MQNFLRKVVFFLFAFAITSTVAFGQSLLLKRTIMPTDTTVDDNGNSFAVSSDDAEQENDEIDTLFDDDIDAGWEGEPDDLNILTAGMRFRDIQIPQGAKIDSAFFVVFSHEGKNPEDIARITITGHAADNAPTFTEDMLITDRPRTTASVLWEVAEEWFIYQPYRTVDVSSIIQELVDRDGWQNGNAMAFIFQGEDQGPSEVENAREWEAFENIADPEDGGDGQNHPERVAQLLIYYSAEANKIDVAIAVTDTTTDDDGNAFAVSSDDAEQENDEIDTLFDDDIDAGWEGEPDDLNILTAGMRFRDLQIPQGATIDSAYVIVFSHEGKEPTDVARITIVADDTDNAPTFTEDSLLTDRAQTEAAVLWEVAEQWEIYQPYKTVDISPVVQEIVDREGWAPGNAIALLFKGEDQGPSEVENAREWEAFENIADPEDGGDGQNHPERVARIVVHYSNTPRMVNTPIAVTDTVIDDDGNKFAVSSDDAEQENDEIDTLFDDDIDAGWEGEPDDLNILTAGMRFRNIYIPQGAKIDSAYFVVYSHEGKNPEDVARITITGEATDDAMTFTEDMLITARPRTEASALWEVAESWEIYQPYRTVDVSPIVQELVDREGWEAGNSMAFIFEGEDQGPSEVENAREWEAFENIADPEDGGDGQHHPERIARFVAFWSAANTSVSIDEKLPVAYNQLLVYPNPSTEGQVQIELVSARKAELRLYNQNGQLVSEYTTANRKNVSLNTSTLTSGMYYLQVVQDQKLYTHKLIINNN